jgi:hypothetical protein
MLAGLDGSSGYFAGKGILMGFTWVSRFELCSNSRIHKGYKGFLEIQVVILTGYEVRWGIFGQKCDNYMHGSQRASPHGGPYTIFTGWLIKFLLGLL